MRGGVIWRGKNEKGRGEEERDVEEAWGGGEGN